MVRKLIFIFSLAILLSLLFRNVNAYCENNQRVEVISIYNNPDCLRYSIDLYCSSAGLMIENNCHLPLYILFEKDGNKIPGLKIVNEEISYKINTETLPHRPVLPCHNVNSPVFQKVGCTDGAYFWIIEGKLGDADIEIHGKNYLIESDNFWKALYHDIIKLFNNKIEYINPRTGYKKELKIVNQVIKRNDVEDCEMINNENIYKICLALGSSQFEQCNEITEQGTRDTCNIKAAHISENSSYCSIIDDNDLRDICFFQLATKTKDIKNCAAISFYDKDYNGLLGSGDIIFGRKSCYQELAEFKKDPKYCECLENYGDYWECKYTWIEVAKGNRPIRDYPKDGKMWSDNKEIPHFCFG